MYECSEEAKGRNIGGLLHTESDRRLPRKIRGGVLRRLKVTEEERLVGLDGGAVSAGK